MGRRSIVAAAFGSALVAVLFAAGAAPAAPPTLTATCSPGPADCGGWFRNPVTVSWSATNVSSLNCPPVTFSSDTKGSKTSCTATGSDGQTTITVTVTIHLDRTPPSVQAAPERAPDAGGWYNHPVGVGFAGVDATSGIASCTGSSYGGPDTGGVTLGGSCTDVAGNSASASFALRYDATPPQVTKAVPARKPDNGRWYRRPVSYGFEAADGLAGLEGCAPATYGGPDGIEARVTGSCRDRAGNVGARSFVLSYDATPPGLHLLYPEAVDGVARVHWRAAPDAVRFSLARRSMRRGSGWASLYRGQRKRFLDPRLETGAAYVYRLKAWDVAGNVAVQRVGVRVRSSLLPGGGARVGKRLVLTWHAVEHARYYNVQLYRNGVKVLTRWPSAPKLPVARLKPGRYRWYVWPGLGPRAAHRYGRLLGTATFVVR